MFNSKMNLAKDLLSNLSEESISEEDLNEAARSLHQAVLLHGLAGDCLVNKTEKLGSMTNNDRLLLVGQRGLQAQDMPAAIRHVMQLMTE